MKKNIKSEYLAPELEVNYAEVEAGFLVSIEDPIEGPEQDW